MSKRNAPGASAPPSLSPEEAASLSLYRFGAELFDAAPPAGGGVQLQRFGDYVAHFGFSPDGGAAAAAAGESTSAAAARAASAGGLFGAAVPEAASGIALGMRAEADAQSVRCRSAVEETLAPLGDLTGSQPAAAPVITRVAAQLSEPFAARSWRQSQSECGLKSARAIYSWLCDRLQTIHLRDPPVASADAAATAPGATADGTAKSKAAAGAARGAAGKKKATKGVGAAAATVAADAVQEAPAAPPDPLLVALVSRACTPQTAAQLFKALMEACQAGGAPVRCELVEGFLKGRSPSESVPWVWNRLCVGGKQYLLDVAAGAAGRAAQPKAPAAAGKDKKSEEGRPARGAPVAAPLPARADEDKLPLLSLTQRPRWADDTASTAAADFYFLTDPAQLIHTHYPSIPGDSLLTQICGQATWESSPRLASDFFRFPVQLSSHSRGCQVAVRGSPFYVSVFNDRPDTTELCGVLYKCSLRDLPEALGGPDCPQSLEPQWVWQQRCEALREDTFTLMVPAGGYYSFVIGARSIRADPYSCRLPRPEDGFTPLVRYQVKVNFAPTAHSLLPRQHLSTSFVRLLSPLSRYVAAGQCAFALMPSCSNVQAVAVVACTNAAAPARAESDADAAKDRSPPTPPRRRLLRFLEFSAQDAVYAGEADVHAGDSIELWVRYAAADRNGQTLAETVAAAEGQRARREAEAAAAAPSPAPRPGTRSGGHKGREAVGEPSAVDVERRALAQRLAAARVFVPAVTGIEVRSAVTAGAQEVIQPHLAASEERSAVLLRLAGVTPDLLREAALLQQRETPSVGSFFDTRAAPTA